MNQNTQQRHERKISAARLRRFIADIADDITNGVDSVKIAVRGNTFAIHLEGATINISLNSDQKGGEQ